MTKEQRDKWYEENKKRCLYCGEYIPLDNLTPNKYKNRKFCCRKCFVSYSNMQRGNGKYESTIIQKDGYYKKDTSKKYCLNCGKELQYPVQRKYCCIECQHEYSYKEYIRKWKSGEISGTKKDGASEYIKRYIREKYNNQCCKCGWHEINPITGKVPLEVHHKDGNYQNNKEDNLELLCPNCHSLTPTYKALNCGEGRKDRYK